MNFLSLFDGMSCGRIACERAGITVDNYFASEVDKYAIQVSKANWPGITHIGDVRGIHVEYDAVTNTTYMHNYVTLETFSCKGKLDSLLGGSPCQGFSFAGKQLNFNDPRSALFFEYVRILNEIKAFNPEVKFLLENVMMKQEYQDVISSLLGVKPIKHNSALVSAQNRKRLYWVNIPFHGQPRDRGIVLKDILKNGCTTVNRWVNSNTGAVHDDNKAATLRSSSGTDIRKRQQVVEQTGVIKNKYEVRNDKAMCLDANYFKGEDNHGQRTCIQVGLADDIGGYDINRRVYSPEGIAPTLISKSSKGGFKGIKIAEDDRGQRSLIRQINPSKDAAGKQPYMQDRVYDENYKSIAVTREYASRLNVGKVLQLAGLTDEVNQFEQNRRVYTENSLSPTLSINPHAILKVEQNGYTYRKLTVTECERLQCVPDGYCQRFSAAAKQISNTQAYKMLGNGWCVDSIVLFLEPLGEWSFLYAV